MKWSIIGNTASQILGKLLTAGTTFAASVLIARSFGIDVYGDYIKITTFVAFFYLLTDFGLNAQSIIDQKQSPLSPNPVRRIFAARLLLSLFWVVVALAVLVFLPTGTTGGYTNWVKLGVIFFLPTVLFQGLLTSSNAVFQAQLRYELSTLAVGLGSVLTIVLLVAAIAVFNQSGGYWATLVAFLAGSLVTALSAVGFVRRLLPPQSIAPAWPPGVLSLVVKSLPLAFTLFCNLVYFRVDSVILTLTRPTWEVGVYGFVYKIFELPLVAPTFFMNSLYPVMVSRAGAGRPAIFFLAKKAAFWLGSGGVVAAGIFFLAAPLLSLIRPEFAFGVGALRVLALGLPVFFLTGVTMWTLVVLKKRLELVVVYGSAMITNILANSLLVPRHGFIAAAWVTVAGEILVLLTSAWLCWRERKGEHDL